VASHGGSLTIDSVVGKGTMVVIALPTYLHPMDGIAGA
jgi:signal transduction histidine kinase